jgi:hypothetical protein
VFVGSVGITCKMLNVDSTEVTFVSFSLVILVWMLVMMDKLYATNLSQEMRIIRLSHNLQLAECNTGQPYYTGISIPVMSYEPNILTTYRTAKQPSTIVRRKRAFSM